MQNEYDYIQELFSLFKKKQIEIRTNAESMRDFLISFEVFQTGIFDILKEILASQSNINGSGCSHEEVYHNLDPDEKKEIAEVTKYIPKF